MMTDPKRDQLALHTPEITAEGSVIKYVSGLRNFVHNLWLFNYSDIKCIIIPHTLLAVANARSGHFVLTQHATTQTTVTKTESWSNILPRIPPMFIWIYLNLLVECVANQRLPASVQEDLLNKPWRPLPSKHMTPATAKKLLFCLIPTALLLSCYMGDMQFKASAALMSFIWLYNDLNGADFGPLVRNVLNACGLLSFAIGGTAIAVSIVDSNSSSSSSSSSTRGGTFSPTAVTWFAILWSVICTTIHAQDFADVEGDKVRGRMSAPLIYGDRLSRWSVAVPVMFWSLTAPMYWGMAWHDLGAMDNIIGISVLSVGIILCILVVTSRSLVADRWVWRLWCLWSTTLFLLPLMGIESSNE
jgi:4-hydroxybenzoate polyprenyltransferase